MSKNNDDIKLKKYLSGELNNKEAHELEKDALNDPFLLEALEGFEDQDPKLVAQDIESLKSQIASQSNPSTNWLKIAAVVMLLMVSSIVGWQLISNLEEGESLADNGENTELHSKESEESIDSFDTLSSEINEKNPVVDQSNNDGGLNTSLPSIANLEEESQPQIEPEIQETTVNEVIASKEDQVENVEVEETFFQAKTDSEPATIAEVLQGRASGIIVEPGPDVITSAASVSEDVATSDANEVSSFSLDTSRAIALEQESNAKANEAATKKTPIRIRGVSSLNKRTTSSGPTISGRVIDESGEGIPGAAIIIKNTTTGTTTDLDGNFIINANPGTELIVSYIGFSTQELTIPREGPMNITLDADMTTLSEVVVSGYGIEQKDQSAKPSGGFRVFQDYVDENLIFPDKAKNEGIKGSVVLEVEISKSGFLDNVEVRKSLSPECDEEAIRLVRSYTSWENAVENGTPISDSIRIRIKFK